MCLTLHLVQQILLLQSTSELCQWLSDNTGRLSYIDDAQEEGLIAAEADTFKRLQIGQFECIRSMAVRIIERLQSGH